MKKVTQTMTDNRALSLIEKTTNDQNRAANPEFSVWASANAGAGKTKVLIDRIARLLLFGTPPEKILAVTYTKAAAAEMTTRLFETLGEWAVAEDEILAQKLFLLDDKLVQDLPKARALFARALETPGGLKIETIHAFCGTILKRFPLEAGVPPGFEVIEDIGAIVLLDKAFEMLANQRAELLSRIEALTYGEKHQELIKAASEKLGVGSNFNRADYSAKIGSIFDLEENDTPEAAKGRAVASLDKDLLLECAEILEASGSKTDVKTALVFREINVADTDNVFDKVLGLLLTTKKVLTTKRVFAKKLENDPSIIKLCLAPPLIDNSWIGGQLARFWREAQTVQSSQIRAATLDLLEAAWVWQAHYSALKRAAGKLDFADLLTATSKLLNQDNGGALWVLYKLDQGLSHVLIDESQDTSAEQWELLTPLLDALEDETYDRFAKGPRTRFIVGDEKQSIYSFQGASPERFGLEHAKFEDAARLPRGEYASERKSIPFEVSFRTGQTILNTVDRVWDNINKKIDFGPEDAELETKFEKRRSHFSSRIGQASQVELWPIEFANGENEDRSAWDIPLNADSETSPSNMLATRIAREIRNRIDSAELVWDKDEGKNPIARPLVESDIMILVKQRKALFHSIIRKLKGEGLRVAGSDQIVFGQEPAIIDLLSLGRFVLRPEDDFNLACVLKSAFCGLLNDDEHLFPLAYNRGSKSLWQSLKEAQDPVYSNAKVFLTAQTLRAEDIAPFEFFAKLLDAKLPDGRTGWRAIIERFGNEAREPIEVFLDTALKADKLGAASLGAFLDIIEYTSPVVKRDLNAENIGIRVMTVHASKGLEAKIVILPDTTRALNSKSNGLFYDSDSDCLLWAPTLFFEPALIANIKERNNLQAIDEDKRLLYVAMTRARDRLIVCGHQHPKNNKNGYSKDSWYGYFAISEPYFGPSAQKPLVALPIDRNDAKLARIWGDNIDKSKAGILLPSKEMPKIPIPHWFDNPPNPESAKLRIAQPSMLTDEVEEVFLSPNQRDNKRRFLRGKLIHELLEGFGRIKPESREQWAIRRLRNIGELQSEAKGEIIHHALGIVENPEFAFYFSEKSRSEVSIVGTSKLLPNDMVISGTIDRLIIGEHEVLVLDFKTNRPPPATKDGIPKIYINQMAAYFALLSETYPERKIKCALLWTDTPVLMELGQEQIDTALKNLK